MTSRRRPPEQRLAAARHLLALLFAQGREDPARAAEAIRLARVVHRAVPDDGETTGLLALLLLHGDDALVAEARQLLADACCIGPPGSFLRSARALAETGEAATENG